MSNEYLLEEETYQILSVCFEFTKKERSPQITQITQISCSRSR